MCGPFSAGELEKGQLILPGEINQASRTDSKWNLGDHRDSTSSEHPQPPSPPPGVSCPWELPTSLSSAHMWHRPHVCSWGTISAGPSHHSPRCPLAWSRPQASRKVGPVRCLALGGFWKMCFFSFLSVCFWKLLTHVLHPLQISQTHQTLTYPPPKSEFIACMVNSWHTF